MKYISTNPGKFQIGLYVLPLLALASFLSACATGGSSFESTGYVLLPVDRATVNALPKPNVSAVDISGTCRNTSLSFENEAARAAWPAPIYMNALRYWAMYHVGSRAGKSAPKCRDEELSVRLWQSAIGTPITGRMSERDVAEYVAMIDRVDARYAEKVRLEKMTPEERAVDHYYAAAHQGDAKAQFRLGVVYDSQGNLKEAKKWFTKSAKQGFPLAMKELGLTPRAPEPPRNLSRDEILRYYPAPPNSQTLPRDYYSHGLPPDQAAARMAEIGERQRTQLMEDQAREAEERRRAAQEEALRQQNEYARRMQQQW